MSIELKQAAQDAAEAIDWLLKNIRRDAPQLSGKSMGNAEKCACSLRTAIQQAETEPCKSFTELRDRHREGVDAELAAMAAEAKTDEPVAYGVPNGNGGVKFGKGWAFSPKINTALNATMPLYTHPATGVPDDVVKDAERYRWLRENGTLGFSGAPSWRASVSFDAVDAYAQTLDSNIDAAQAQKGQP